MKPAGGGPAGRRGVPVERVCGLILVVLAHLLVAYWLWQATPRLAGPEAAPVFVHFVAEEKPPAPPPPRAVTPAKPATRPAVVEPLPQLLAEPVPQAPPVEKVVPAPPPVTVPALPTPPVPVQTEVAARPLALNSELSAVCRHRPAPAYPAAARRRGETGRVVLRVDLDEGGRVSAAAVAESSGSRWLDEAALAAVRGWQCEPARRGGEPVRATAIQPFSFVLQGG